PNRDKLGFSVPEIMATLGINNRNKIYQLFHSGELESYTIGSRRFSSREAILRFIKKQEQEAQAKPIVARGANGKTREARA
ncbi:MAG: helix-turn-helix domain-containing protein, partial [Gammaproteobacteria bacterium]